MTALDEKVFFLTRVLQEAVTAAFRTSATVPWFLQAV
jgi:hypothetical protein